MLQLQELTDLTPIEINDAVELLEQAGLVETLKADGTKPFNFCKVELTPRGRYEYVRELSQQSQATREETRVSEKSRVCFWSITHRDRFKNPRSHLMSLSGRMALRKPI